VHAAPRHPLDTTVVPVLTHPAVGQQAAAASAWGNGKRTLQEWRGQQANDAVGIQPLDSGLGGAEDDHALTPLTKLVGSTTSIARGVSAILI